MSTDRTQTGGIRGMRRTQVATTRLIETAFLPGKEEQTPLIVTPAVENVDLAEWCTANKDELDGYLDRYGAIVFKGFGLESAADFERTAAAVSPELFAEYGDLPQESTTERIYHSTPYPADKTILFHNESSHLPQWPLRQFFFCVIPAADRGQTPLLDCRRRLRRPRSRAEGRVRREGAHVRPELLGRHRRAVAGLLPHDRPGGSRADVQRGGHGLRVDCERRPPHQSGLHLPSRFTRAPARSCSSTRSSSITSRAWTKRRGPPWVSSSPRRTCRATSTSATARPSRTRSSPASASCTKSSASNRRGSRRHDRASTTCSSRTHVVRSAASGRFSSRWQRWSTASSWSPCRWTDGP